jgi:hypothetical protein
MDLWTLNSSGIAVFYDYQDQNRDEMGWLEEFGFFHNQKRVRVFWRHPRFDYRDKLLDVACDLAIPLSKEDCCDDAAINNYDWKIGELVKFLSSSDQGIVIRPSITLDVDSGDSCQNVDLILPVEVRCESDLVPLADIVRRYLQGDQNVLDGYAEYTFADWKADGKPYYQIKNQEER